MRSPWERSCDVRSPSFTPRSGSSPLDHGTCASRIAANGSSSSVGVRYAVRNASHSASSASGSAPICAYSSGGSAASSASRAVANASSAARRSASADAFTPGTSSLRKPSSAAWLSLRTRTALRERGAPPARGEAARFGAVVPDERRAPGGGSGCRQIGQLEMKRL